MGIIGGLCIELGCGYRTYERSGPSWIKLSGIIITGRYLGLIPDRDLIFCAWATGDITIESGQVGVDRWSSSNYRGSTIW